MPLIQWENESEQAHTHIPPTINTNLKPKLEYSIEYDDVGNPFIVEEELPEEAEETYDYARDDFNYDQSRG